MEDSTEVCGTSVSSGTVETFYSQDQVRALIKLHGRHYNERCPVAVSGPIGFVGLVCPHLSRTLVGTDQRRLLPVSTAVGAALLAVADAASRTLSRADLAQTLLPVGVLTGLLGGPFFLVLLWRARRTGLFG